MLSRACPKCRGDLRIEHDLYGGQPDLMCLQCGYVARPDERAAMLARLAGRAGPSSPDQPVRRAS